MYGIKNTDIKVFETNNYDLFKKLKGNRSVELPRIKAITESIRKGYIISPIIVNEFYEVIDGQGRLEALKSLNMPVHFIIEKGAGLDECIRMNIKQKNWTVKDFIAAYADLGYADYRTLAQCIKIYDEIPLINIAAILGGRKYSGSGDIGTFIKEGRFCIYDLAEATKILNYIKLNLESIAAMGGRTSSIVATLGTLLREELIDPDRMSVSLSKYNQLGGPCYNVDSTLDSLQTIYNYNRRDKELFRDAYYARSAIAKKAKKEE